MKPAMEANFDGLVGPTHNYAGLSRGNLASLANKTKESDPKTAALEGLEKMRLLIQHGLVQGILPPHERPDFRALHKLGFRGKEGRVLEKVFAKAPELLANCSSASSMWTANAATVSPSADSQDEKLHFTAANLVSKFHRSLETKFTSQVLRTLFNSPKFFAHHSPLLASPTFGDEGAANHTRLCQDYGGPGVEIFTFGRFALREGKAPKIFPARQTFESCQAISRLHRLPESKVILAQQNPAAIDAGVFHNDVISVGNRNVFLVHEDSFLMQKTVLKEIERKFNAVTGHPLFIVLVPRKSVSLKDSVHSYLFNSQLISVNEKEMILIAPSECRETKSVNRFIKRLIESGKTPLNKVEYVDIRQSMRNGGGPACLRLRVVLTPEQFRNSHRGTYVSGSLYAILRDWVTNHYRDRLEIKDLADIRFIYETRAALEELTKILDLANIYPFQKNA